MLNLSLHRSGLFPVKLLIIATGRAWVNHLTRHCSGSPNAAQYLFTEFEHESGRRAEVTISEYEQGTGWKNDPNKAGLDLEN